MMEDSAKVRNNAGLRQSGIEKCRAFPAIRASANEGAEWNFKRFG
jgi:hypothetical protein